MKQKIQKEWFVLAAMVAVIIFGGTYRLTEVGQPIMNPDEFGYWANSAYFMGLDWSPSVQVIGYYSYGYSLLLVPIRILTKIFDWDWRQKYQAMVVVQSFMLTGIFLMSVKICKRYLSDLHWFVQDLLCLVMVLYPSYMIYAHMTSTETTLFFMFWVYLYILMRLTDYPTMRNHVGFAFASFYMYTVHQRALPMIIAAIMTVFSIRLLKVNKLSHVGGFFLTMFLCNCVHSAIKGKLQNDLYKAADPAGMQEIFGYVFNKKTLILVVAIVFILLLLWLIEHGRGRIALALGTLVLAAGLAWMIKNFALIEAAAENTRLPMSVNDFAVQIWRIRDILTIEGLLRFLISIAGKWFYIATASGLVICFGIWHLGGRFIKTSIKGISRISYVWKKNDGINMEPVPCNRSAIWLWGAFLAWLGIFGISAFAMSGIGRIDNLIYGRYQEFAVGILLLYGFYSLIKDRKWIRHMALFIILYLLAAWLCQYLFNELENTTFVVSHCLMMGLFVYDGEVPVGKVWEAAAYSGSIGILFCIIVKAAQIRLSKISVYRMIAALTAAVCLYAYMGTSVFESYVIYANNLYERKAPTIAMWIDRLYQGENIYFIKNGSLYLWGLVLQYYLDDKIVTMKGVNTVPQNEEAFYVVILSDTDIDKYFSQCGVIVNGGGIALLAPYNSEIYERMEDYYN